MSTETHSEHEDDREEQQDFGEDRVDEIGGSLMDTIEADARLQSGVPGDKRVGDLDFIQMTGLTRPTAKAVSYPPAPAPAPPMEDLDPSRPVSFFESGVRDVDHTLAPMAMEVPSAPRPPLSSPPVELVSSSSADALKKIVADLAESPDLFQETEVSESADVPFPLLDQTAEAPPEPSTEEEPSSLDETLSKLLAQFQVHETELPTASSLSAPPPSVEAARGPVDADRRLVEAEQLLQELEQQPRASEFELAGDTSAGVPHRFEWHDPGPSFHDLEPESESERRIVYDYSAAPGRHRKTRNQLSRQRRRFIRVTSFILLLCGAGVGAYGIYRFYINPAIMTPEEMITLAMQQMNARDFEGASRTYARFAQRYASHPFRPEAEFNAAYALRAEPVSGPKAEALRKQSLAFFETFVTKNPSDPRRPRAESMMGIIQYELGHYEQAISFLREPTRIAQDPGAALPILRALAGAYRQMGDYEHAESACLQAAVLPKNYTCDADYYELGDMACQRAKQSTSKEERDKLLRSALDYWNKALHVNSIDPGTREDIQKQMDRIETETGVTVTKDAAKAVPVEEAVPGGKENLPAPQAGASSPPPTQSDSGL